MTADIEFQNRVAALRHLMADEDHGDEFVMPTALKEVPSYTSINTVPLEHGGTSGELRRHPTRDSGRAA
ncbi:MAG: hypothetical protein EOP09_01650 [Proteobacteria bacterium]|nr:MAG: hypothetical protein EOP09_01650 [Pseudomonadota bacterium]